MIDKAWFQWLSRIVYAVSFAANLKYAMQGYFFNAFVMGVTLWFYLSMEIGLYRRKKQRELEIVEK